MFYKNPQSILYLTKLHLDPKKPFISRLDPAARDKYMTYWSNGMERVSQYLQVTQHQIPTTRSKHLTPPEINVQGAVACKDQKKRQRKYARLKKERITRIIRNQRTDG